MALSAAFRRVLNGTSSASSLFALHERGFCSASLTTPKLFVSGTFSTPSLQTDVPTTSSHLFAASREIRLEDGFTVTVWGVDGLSRLTTNEKLKEAFSPFGQLVEATVVTDKFSGRSKGFGFVRYATIEEAEKAREGMNAKFLDGWVIFVDPAKPREPRPQPQPEPDSSETGFRTNKTVGWCG